MLIDFRSQKAISVQVTSSSMRFFLRTQGVDDRLGARSAKVIGSSYGNATVFCFISRFSNRARSKLRCRRAFRI